MAWSGHYYNYITEIFNIIGGKEEKGIDTYIPTQIQKRINKFKKLKKLYKIIEWFFN